MTSPTSRDGKENELLKVDTKGRVQIPPERRKDLLEEFDRSGMTGAAFAKHYWIKYTTFAYWIQARRRKQERSGSSGENHFLLVTVDGAKRSGGVTVELPHGVKVTITTQEEGHLAAALIEALSNGR